MIAGARPSRDSLRNLRQRPLQVEHLAWVDFSLKHEVHQVRQEATHRGRTAQHTRLREKQLLSIELDSVRHANIADHGPGRAHWMACVIDSFVPTHSSTASAPTPLVSCFIRATPSSPRSEMMCVAPYSSASSCRAL